MTRHEYDVLSQLSQDIGYIRGQIDSLVEARLPDRMTFVEGQQKIQNQRLHFIETKREKFVAKAWIALGTLATVGTAVAGFTTNFFH